MGDTNHGQTRRIDLKSILSKDLLAKIKESRMDAVEYLTAQSMYYDNELPKSTSSEEIFLKLKAIYRDQTKATNSPPA